MNRTEFFKTTILGGFGIMLGKTADAVSLQEKSFNTQLLKTFVAGYQYYDGANIEEYLKPGLPLLIVREHKNPYDEKAISVYCKQTKLGYIPMTDNAVLANMLDQKFQLQASILAFDPKMPEWERLEVEVRM